MIVYFDGHCNLCNGVVSFLVSRDHARTMRFAPLQGRTARARLPADLVNHPGTMVLEIDSEILIESTAALRTIAGLGGTYRLANFGLMLPRWFRDSVYRLIARHRYRWFGRRHDCRLPTAAEAIQFLE